MDNNAEIIQIDNQRKVGAYFSDNYICNALTAGCIAYTGKVLPKTNKTTQEVITAMGRYCVSDACR
jgi:hypothetical protein